MMLVRKQDLIAAAIAGAFFITSAHSQTTTSDSVKTRIGTLDFKNGYPSKETARKVFDEMDYQRAVQAYLWAYPAVSFESIRIGTQRDLGGDLYDMVIADNFADPKGPVAYSERHHHLRVYQRRPW